jgi:hypothetical protein
MILINDAVGVLGLGILKLVAIVTKSSFILMLFLFQKLLVIKQI